MSNDPADRRLFLLTDAEWDQFQEALERPAEVKPRLAALLASESVFDEPLPEVCHGDGEQHCCCGVPCDLEEEQS